MDAESLSQHGRLRIVHEAGDFSVCVDDEVPERVLFIALPHADPERAEERLASLAAAHTRAAGGPIPAVQQLGRHQGRPFVAFACPAVTDFTHVLGAVQRSGTRAPYAQAITFIDMLLTTVARVQELGLAMGALSTANVFVDAQGGLHLIGVGDNVLCFDADGVPLHVPDVCVAPDISAGAPHSAGADLYAITLLCRRLIPHAIFPPAGERVLQGTYTPDDHELGQLFAWSSLAILGSHPARRPGFAECIEKERRAWQLLEVEPDVPGFAELVRRHLHESNLELVVDEEVTRVRVGSTPSLPIGSRRALRRILSALIEQHRRRPGEAIAVSELVEAGWPGESLIFEAAANRVYVALSSLRKLGLGGVIERCDGGWRLTPSTVVRVETKTLGAAVRPRDAERAAS
jgi:hypothetical protein